MFVWMNKCWVGQGRAEPPGFQVLSLACLLVKNSNTMYLSCERMPAEKCGEKKKNRKENTDLNQLPLQKKQQQHVLWMIWMDGAGEVNIIKIEHILLNDIWMFYTLLHRLIASIKKCAYAQFLSKPETTLLHVQPEGDPSEVTSLRPPGKSSKSGLLENQVKVVWEEEQSSNMGPFTWKYEGDSFREINGLFKGRGEGGDGGCLSSGWTFVRGSILHSFSSVTDPPGPPSIAGYTSGQVVRTNDTLLLTCTSRGGNPLGTVVWYRNNERVDSSFTSGGNKAINEYTFTAMSTDNGVEYRCEVTNLVTAAPLTASFTLTVHCEFVVGVVGF